MLFGTWLFFITILTAFYTANLTAFLTLSKFTLPIENAADIGRNKYYWITREGNYIQMKMMVRHHFTVKVKPKEVLESMSPVMMFL